MKYITILILALSLSVCSTAKTVKEVPFTVELDSPKYLAGSLEAQFDSIIKLAGHRNVKLIVEYYPLEDAVCIQYRLDFTTFYMFFDSYARKAFLKALEQYKEDFANKALETKGSKKTRRKYDRVDIYLIWQAFTYSLRAKANTFVDYGYDVQVISKTRVAFFTMYRMEAIYRDMNASEQSRRVTPNEPIYFSRAQAEELAELFDQDFLKSLNTGNIKLKPESTNPDAY